MIYVECKPDATLVRVLTNLPLREISHAGGKYKLCQLLEKQHDCKGLVDEDPLRVQPSYIKKLQSKIEELPQYKLKVINDESRTNRLIILCPNLEEWILKATKMVQVKITKFGLSDNPSELHKQINLNQRHFEKLIKRIKESEMLKTLKILLEK